MKVPPGGFVKRKVGRQHYPVLAYRWVDPERSVFGHHPTASESLEAYRAVANIRDLLKPKVRDGDVMNVYTEWTLPHVDVEVFDPEVDKVWTVNGSLIEDFQLAAINVHWDPACAGRYPA
jgi:hypothetical protein